MTNEQIATPVELSPRGRLGFLLKDSVVYGASAAISKAFALVTFPILARNFSVADYGIVDFYLTLVNFLAALFIFGQDSAVARFFYEYSGNAERRQLISQSLCFQLAGLLVLMPALWVAAETITAFLFHLEHSDLLFRTILLQLPFILVINFSVNLLKWTFARTQFLVMSLGATALQALLLVAAVVWFDVGLLGVLLVSLCTSVVFAALGLYFVRGWIARPRDFVYLRQMLPFAVPLGLICAAGGFWPVLERGLTEQILGGDALGLYAAGTKVATLLGLVVGAFQTAWGPFSLSLYKAADSTVTYNSVLKIFSTAICCVVLLLAAVASPTLHLLASARYEGAAAVVLPLALGLAVQATSWITEIGIGISKRSHLNLYPYAAGLLTTLVSVPILAASLGLVGIASGVLIGHIARATLATWLAQCAYPLPWVYRPTILVFTTTAIIGVCATLAGVKWGMSAQTAGLGIGLGALLGMTWRAVLTGPERNRLLVVVSRVRRVGRTADFPKD